MNLKVKTIRGVLWNTIGKVSSQVLQFAMTIILMRLLLPEDYGLIAMAMVLIGFANIFSEFGFSSALIQNQKTSILHESSIFWLNIITGFILTCIFYLFANELAVFYSNPDLVRIIKFLSFTFLLSSFNIVPVTILQKNMRYDLMNKIELSSQAASNLIGVILAYNGFGVMSLVYQTLSLSIFKGVLLFSFNNWKPNLVFNLRYVKELFTFSAYLTGFNFINYWARRADDLLIGKFLGATNLGVYSRAYALMLLPITQVIGVISNVMFPTFSTIQHDKERIKNIYLKVLQVLAFITFPMMIGLITVADNFILSIFGQKWIEVVPIIRILAVVGLLQTLTHPTGWVYTSQNKTNLMFYIGLIVSTVIVISIVIGIILGTIQWVAYCYLIANFLIIYPVIKIPNGLIKISFGETINCVKSSFVLSIIMMALIYLLSYLLPGHFSSLLKLIIQITFGLVIYISINIMTKNEVFMMVTNLYREFRSKSAEKTL